jgi:hypothetical protein
VAVPCAATRRARSRSQDPYTTSADANRLAGLPQRQCGLVRLLEMSGKGALVAWEGPHACALAASVDHAGWGGAGGGSTTGNGGAVLLPGSGAVRGQ